ncbi:TIGR01212 family radical SAM protein [Treponema zioleckii]|uniref:TIGR01212 family radical SAM protein n=1 Tax=Treponema zioleckii TaxID=331680 RepID=UPI00168A9446|nr:TIGR01212 family radical SAM protein [Treponema zioleckii]
MSRFISTSEFYKKIFGGKVYKIALDAGCTCPNRDGSKGWGGCIFCSERGSGDFIPSGENSIKNQIEKAKLLVHSKLRGRGGKNDGKYIVYFQNFTSTYGNYWELIKKYDEALAQPDIVGLAIGTRPDCLGDEILEYLSAKSEHFFVQLELGLQTSNELTGKIINRCYTNEDYVLAVNRIRNHAPKIHLVTHVIFGLPGETHDDMMSTIRFVSEKSLLGSNIFCPSGIKITVLYVVKNTVLAKMYENGEFDCLEKSEYYELLKTALKILPSGTVIHRLTGDPPKSILIAPAWTTDKKRVMNEIRKIMSL